jgi:hypothetical protein
VVDNENNSGFYVLNPFFVSLFRDHAIWLSTATLFNDPWRGRGLDSSGAEEFGKFASLPRTGAQSLIAGHARLKQHCTPASWGRIIVSPDQRSTG